MKEAKYLIRFDDICPTMNWDVWEEIEKIVDGFGLKPILAVVPDNQDRHLMHGKANERFWERVRAWSEKGWSVGLHGFQHLYETRASGIVGLNHRSEFAGLPIEVQREKIQRALRIFYEEKVKIDCWIAPAHSFDWDTVDVLLSNGVAVISDGYFNRAVTYRGALWVPQQLWRFEEKRAGLWTVCYHHNSWSAESVEKFKRDITCFSKRIIGLSEVVDCQALPEISIYDKSFAFFWKWSLFGRRALSTFLRKTPGMYRLLKSIRQF